MSTFKNEIWRLLSALAAPAGRPQKLSTKPDKERVCDILSCLPFSHRLGWSILQNLGPQVWCTIASYRQGSKSFFQTVPLSRHARECVITKQANLGSQRM